MSGIRLIAPRDDAAVERIIRDCLIEFGADHPGCAWEDDLSHFSTLYSAPGTAYWVAEEEGRVIAGVGIGGARQHPTYGRVCGKFSRNNFMRWPPFIFRHKLAMSNEKEREKL